MDEGFVAGCSVSSERLRVIGRLGLLSEYSVPRRAPGNSTDPGSVRFVAEIVPFIAKYRMIDLPLRGASARSLRAAMSSINSRVVPIRAAGHRLRETGRRSASSF